MKTAKGTLVVLEPDFKFDGAPVPKLGFGKNGYFKSTQFSKLKSNSDKQTYEIPVVDRPARLQRGLGPVRKVFRAPGHRDFELEQDASAAGT